jgi:ribosome assembly protein 1
MFVQLVLEQIWAVYSATTGGDKGKGCVDFLNLLYMFKQLVELQIDLVLTLSILVILL